MSLWFIFSQTLQIVLQMRRNIKQIAITYLDMITATTICSIARIILRRTVMPKNVVKNRKERK